MPTNINKLNHITLKAIHLKDARLCELVQIKSSFGELS